MKNNIPWAQGEAESYIKQGDCLELMKEIPDGSVDLTVTSPPYDDLRTYNGNVSQWNFEKFQAIAKELFRVTADGGVLVWVVGDQTKAGSETGSSFRQALFFMDCGFKLNDTMIYAKKNPLPQNHTRYEQCFEYMFVLVKGKLKTFNPLTEPTVNAGKTIDWGGRPSVMDKLQCRHDRGHDPRTVKSEKVRTNIFYYAVGGGNTGHPAVFPDGLAEDQILSWSNPGDVVLDPFLGSGTTAKMAVKNGRKYIGFELDPGYFEIAQKRITDALNRGSEITEEVPTND